MTFFIVQFLRGETSLIVLLTETNLQYKIKEPNIPELAKQNYCMSFLIFGLRICGTQLATILYLVNKSLTNVAELYFI